MKYSRPAYGFSLPELAAVLAITLIILATSVPSLLGALQSYRAAGDAHGIARQLSLTKMRAAAEFTQARLDANLSNGTYQVQLLNKTTNTFVAEGGIQKLSGGTVFSLGALSIPAGTQSTISQTPQVVFNSRGIPVDSTGSPTGGYALYLGNSAGQHYAVTVSPSGKVSAWRFDGSQWQPL